MDDDTQEAPRTKQRMTNVEFVTELMEFSQCGALSQIFIIDAIMKHADAVAKADAEKLDHPLIRGQAWIACAQEIKARMEAQYGRGRAGGSSEQH